jgi:cytidine deaminase
MSNTHSLQDAIAQLPVAIQSLVSEALSNGPVLPSELVNDILEAGEIEIGTLMIKLLPTAATYARVPISNFHVGAVSLGMPPAPPIRGPGSLYLGANMEFVGQALSFGVHGEQSATNNAWLHGEVGLQALAINAAPCGYCRQFLYELTTATKGFNILLKKNQQDPKDYSYTQETLIYYLPDAFGPKDLGLEGGLMEPEAHGLTISSTDTLAVAALAAANASYSPYTKDYSGVAIQTSSGSVYAGRYAENAAYNPSMSPMESALALLNMSEAENTPYAIASAALVEASSSASQKSAAEDVLASVAPGIQLGYFTAV